MKKVVRFPIDPYLPNIGVNGKMMLRAPKFVKPRRKTLMSRPQNFDKPKRKWFRILWPIHQRNHEVNLLLVLTKKKNKKKNKNTDKNKNKNKKVSNLPERKKSLKETHSWWAFREWRFNPWPQYIKGTLSFIYISFLICITQFIISFKFYLLYRSLLFLLSPSNNQRFICLWCHGKLAITASNNC